MYNIMVNLTREFNGILKNAQSLKLHDIYLKKYSESLSISQPKTTPAHITASSQGKD